MPVLKFWNPRTRRHEPVSGPVGVMGDASGVVVTTSVPYGLAGGASVKIPFGTVTRDSGGFWSAGASTRLTVPVTGLYLVECAMSGTVASPPAAAGYYHLLIYKNGSNADMDNHLVNPAGWMYPNYRIAKVMWLVAGDYIEFQVQNQGGSQYTFTAQASMTRQAVGQPGPQGPRGPGVMGTVIRRVYTSIGTTTWTKPEGLHHIEVECQGGGGGAGGASQNIPPGAAVSGGGGGGGYARSVLLAAELPASCAVVVGGGGAGGWSGDGPGSPGAHSTFSGTGVYVAGYGAAGGAASGQGNGWAVVPGGGGGSGVGQLIVIGSDAPVGWVVTMDGGTYSPTGGPHGGASHLGGARQGTMNGNGVVGYAGGGGGGPVIGWAVISHYSGGAGGQGVVIVTEHYG